MFLPLPNLFELNKPNLPVKKSSLEYEFFLLNLRIIDFFSFELSPQQILFTKKFVFRAFNVIDNIFNILFALLKFQGSLRY